MNDNQLRIGAKPYLNCLSLKVCQFLIVIIVLKNIVCYNISAYNECITCTDYYVMNNLN